MRLTSSDVESVNIAICTTFHESCPHCKHCEVWDWTQFFEKLTREKWVIQWTRHFHKWVDQLAMHQFGPSECSVQPTQKKEKQWLSWCSQCGFSQPSKGFCTFWQELNFHSKKEENAQLPKSNFWIYKAAKDHFGESSTMLSEVIQTLPVAVVYKSQFLHQNSPLIPKLFLSQTHLLPPHSSSQTFIPLTPRPVTRLADSLSQCFDAAIAPERSFLLPVLLWCDSRAVLHACESQNQFWLCLLCTASSHTVNFNTNESRNWSTSNLSQIKALVEAQMWWNAFHSNNLQGHLWQFK